MIGQTKQEDAGVRFDGYLRELREFFASRGVGFGHPEDVIAFAARVSAPGPFQDEMGSMVRSILYCEDERLGREELLELVVVAVGGPAVEPGMEGLQQAVRQLFGFVNTALRQRGSLVPAASGEQAETELTAGEILRSEEPAPVALPEPVAPSQPQAPAEVAVRRRSTAGDGMLFRAVTMAAEEPAMPLAVAAGHDSPRRPRNGWVLPVGAFVAAALVVLYLAWPVLMRAVAGRRAAAGADASTNAASVAGPVGAAACVAPIPARVSRVAVEQQSLMAHNMLDQKMYTSALPQLQAIAAADPGYPGVYLDLSNALLEMKMPEQARVAVDRQIGIVECLVKLPPAELDGYCREQFAPSAVAACRPQLAHLRQTSELQAAMVHLALGHQADPGDGAAAMEELKEDEGAPAGGEPPARSAASSPAHGAAAKVAPIVRSQAAPIVRRPPPAAREGDADRPQASAARSPGLAHGSRTTDGDPSLRRGEGTDSVFGAYQKPQ